MDMSLMNLRESERIEAKGGLLYLFCKRCIDIVGSLAGIILLSPLLIIVAIAIKIEDPKGKIFFAQKRCGKNNKLFPMYKFRSMVSNAEELLEELINCGDYSIGQYLLQKHLLKKYDIGV